jgi:hypothetical protein
LASAPTLSVTVAKADDKYVRHSEGSAVELKDGRLLLVWTEFTRGEGDSDFFPARLVAKTGCNSGVFGGSPNNSTCGGSTSWPLVCQPAPSITSTRRWRPCGSTSRTHSARARLIAGVAGPFGPLRGNAVKWIWSNGVAPTP